MSLLSEGTAKATTASGEYGLAIAYGDGATATAEGRTGDYAGNFDLAAAFGNGFSPEAIGGNFLVDILPTLF
jgi:hypothetical protein